MSDLKKSQKKYYLVLLFYLARKSYVFMTSQMSIYISSTYVATLHAVLSMSKKINARLGHTETFEE